MSNDVCVRRATVDDSLSLVTLFAELSYPATAQQIAKRLDRLVADASYEAWIAEDQDRQPLGFAAGHLVFPIEDDDPAAQLIALVVSQTARGASVGSTLCSTFETWAVGCGASRAVLNSGSERTGAHQFYARQGWSHSGLRSGKPLI